MMSRCYSPNDKKYPLYGGRGIRVVKRCHTFINFWEDMKHGYNNTLTLDRINTNGNYSPKNCRWATWKQQQRNRNDTLYVNYKGNRVMLRELCEGKAVDYMLVYQRIKLYGWSLEKSLTIPSRNKNGRINKK